MKILSVLTTILSFFTAVAQIPTVTISASLPNRTDGEVISFDKPIGSFPSAFYLNKNENCTVKNQSINIAISLTDKGLIYLYEKPYATPLMSFYAEPGDTILFKELNGKYIFEGKNAAANAIYANQQIFIDSTGTIDFQPVAIFENQKNEELIKINFESKKTEFTNKFKKLYENKQISKDCYFSFKDLIEQNIDNWAGNLSETFRDNADAKLKFKCQLNTESLNRLIAHFTEKYNTGNNINYASKVLDGNVNSNAKWKLYNLKSKGKVNVGKWQAIGGKLSKEFEDVKLFDFVIDDKRKEMILGRTLLLMVKLQAVETKNAIAAFDVLKENFPNSIFINPIIDQIEQVSGIKLAESKNVVSNNYRGNISFFNDKTGLSVSNSPIKSKSLEALMKEKFTDESIFIDGWATYCGPCIKEFKNSKDLHSFLKSKNIESLYISVDQDVSSERWKKMIADYGLNGYHLFASDKLRDIFNSPFQFIPSYYFYSKGKLKKLDGKPSDKEKFYAQFD